MSLNKKNSYQMEVRFRYSLLAFIIMASFTCEAGNFDPRFLEDVGGAKSLVDLSIYNSSTARQLPGTYRVDIMVNDREYQTQNVVFAKSTESQEKLTGEGIFPCISKTQLADMGVRTDVFPALKSSPAEACSDFTDLIPKSESHFDFNAQKLVLSFPQAAMQQVARGTVPESRWDEGISAMLLDYSFSGSNGTTDSSGEHNDYIDDQGVRHKEDSDNSISNNSYYLNLRSGLNFGAWRLRNTSAWNKNGSEASWDNMGTSLSRDIVSLKSKLALGDTSSPSDIFDSVQMRGAVLSSDDEMLPDSQRGFAPIVRGIANTNAEVVIEQNGYIIYRTFVQPGAFEINDLYPTSSSGDLTVTVKEADGTERHFIQPFSSVAIFQREGHLKYNLAAGEYRGGNYQSGTPKFSQGDVIYGLPYGITTYGGALASDNYHAFALGLGKNLGLLGAVSIDVTQAKSQLDNDQTEQGQSYRFLYAKSFADSGTDFRLMGYKYSTAGYYTFQEATDVLNDADSDYARYHKRSQVQGNLTQQLGSYGSVYLNLSLQDYWQEEGTQRSLMAGYNGRIGKVSWGISYSYSQMPDYDDSDRMVSLNFSVPLGSMWSSYRVTHDQDGQTTHQLGISGTALEQGKLNYNIQEGYGNNGVGNSGNASVGYQGAYGNVDAGYNYTNDSRQVNYSLRGGVIVHDEGVTLSQPLGESMVLVSAPGAKDASITNNAGVSIDTFGNAVVPYATPYRETEIEMRTDSLGQNVDLNEPIQRVVPTRGAVVRASFKTRVGYRVLFTLSRSDGVVPFGTTATLLSDDDKASPVTGIVGEEGQLYMSGLPDKGALKMTWGKSAAEQCQVNYQLAPDKAQATAVVTLIAACK